MIDYPQQTPQIDINDYQIIEGQSQEELESLCPYKSPILIDNQYYQVSLPKIEEIVSSMIYYISNCYLTSKTSSNILSRFTKMLDIDLLNSEEIIPQVESFEGLFLFLESFEEIDKIKYTIWLSNSGEFVLETEYDDKRYFKARFTNSSSVFYNILNKDIEVDILKRETLYELYDELRKYYV